MRCDGSATNDGVEQGQDAICYSMFASESKTRPASVISVVFAWFVFSLLLSSCSPHCFSLVWEGSCRAIERAVVTSHHVMVEVLYLY